jgi:hypothetical protein
MKTKLPSLAGLGLAIGLLFSGCSTVDTRSLVGGLDANRKATEGAARAVVAHGLAVVGNTAAPLHEVAKQNGDISAATDTEIAKIKSDLDAQKKEFQNFVTGALAVVGEVATEVVPGGTTAAKVLGLLNTKVKAAQTGADDAKKDGDAAKKEAAAAVTAATADAQKQLAALKAELESKAKLLEQQAAAKEEQTKRDLDFVRKEFASLSVQQQAVARAEMIKLAEEKGIKGARDMTTEQLIAALSAAGVGLAGLLRTFGKSRNASEVEQLATTQEDHSDKIDKAAHGVDQLWDDVKKLDQKVAVLEHKADACDCPTLAGDLTKLSRVATDHERRLDAVETKTAKL